MLFTLLAFLGIVLIILALLKIIPVTLGVLIGLVLIIAGGVGYRQR